MRQLEIQGICMQDAFVGCLRLLGFLPWISTEDRGCPTRAFSILGEQRRTSMRKYKVKLTFKYSLVIHVEAESGKKAVDALLEQYESFYEAEVVEEK